VNSKIAAPSERLRDQFRPPAGRAQPLLARRLAGCHLAGVRVARLPQSLASVYRHRQSRRAHSARSGALLPRAGTGSTSVVRRHVVVTDEEVDQRRGIGAAEPLRATTRRIGSADSVTGLRVLFRATCGQSPARWADSAVAGHVTRGRVAGGSGGCGGERRFLRGAVEAARIAAAPRMYARARSP
jgi:hypothetical protein